MSERIYLSSPHMGGMELEYINEAFDTNWISPVGPNIDHFEQDISKYMSGIHVAALSSGTAAIHLALIILGVERGDEVICSSFTFAGSCNPIAYMGAVPVFVDSERETWNMDPELLKEAIEDRIKKGKKPKAIIVVHLYGMPAKLDEIIQIGKKYEIPLIEDAAEAFGAEYKGRKAGTFGDISVLSFNGNKIITTSGGGAFLSANNTYVEKAKFLSTQARDHAPHYEHSQIGYNYRMSNISAGIGRGQMEVLDERVRQRRSIFKFYEEKFSGLSGIEFLREPAGHFSNRWLTTALVDKHLLGVDREDIRIGLEKYNIETRPLWKPMHIQPVFKEAPAYTNGTSEELFNRGICLPSGSNLTTSDKERIMNKLTGLFKVTI
ncbi:4-keto-6-deoxy-N-Acetyl-D-hexosaminyl-(Lipid carrier) aminotransferase [Fulvivirga imtechensis AK7]|uniref:GDP-perosamine synthase n=1 Tax=Fulvivirga imtechensis AK7 TaxID=1237149 RepID=L8JSZ8_9BACT|nr:aminotransferase class I/II-fold pyridoxal phosphate-dependent enzyme [Fulvivirga imtechensis]ELR70619.1 4-keto-6-deoxy-N-Acetyl-D-hexosaminyl-(Lipid carrier) aminotransferase [Fulvivirga imtechensis AK7]